MPSATRNPVLHAALPLLVLGARFRVSPPPDDVAALRDRLSHGVRQFEARLAAANVPSEVCGRARYVVCGFLDQMAATTPWGGGLNWVHDGLAVRFGHDQRAGETLFEWIETMSRSPREHVDLLELLYWCVSLGYQGRHALRPDAAAHLEPIRRGLHETIVRARSASETSLSAALRPVTGPERHWSSSAPVWVVAGCVGIALFAILALLRMDLGGRSDDTRARLDALRIAAAAPVAPPAPAARPRLSGLLVEEQRKGWVEVEDRVDHSVIRLTRAAAYPSGSAELSPVARPIVEAIAAEFVRHPGAVLVTGHADSTPIRTARFPSNWHLSEARAIGVQRVLRDRLGPDRPIRTDARADAEPVDRTDAKADPAWNRRVEITLFARP